jgi:uncharacterized protein (TIGR03066 family)
MNVLKLLAALAVVCLVGTGARADDKDTAKKLVGKWEVTKADEGTLPAGTTVEFTKDGKIMVTVKAGDQDMTIEGTYKLDGDKFEIKFKMGDQEHSNTITITKLTDAELHTKDKDGKVVETKKK